MARKRQPAQQQLFKPRGGKRRGAGRPPKGARASAPHKQRPFLHARYPVHVTLRAIAAVGNLRRRCVYQAIREATLTTARREDWRMHREDRVAPASSWKLDWFSSAIAFSGLAEYGDEAFLWRGPPSYDPLIVFQPRTWLLREGWKKSGSISCREVPSKRR